MTTALREFRTFNRTSRLLMVNQFAINVGFYMLMPYLAGHLSGPLGLAGWAVGLALGVRNFSQQGMFLLGGTLADRFGYKPLIVAGCVLRTVGFGLLAAVDSLPTLVIACAATGFAGALFSPAVRAYLAVEVADRRLPAFALFNVFYQGGILIGPLVGLALTAVDFRLTCLVAAAVFACLTVLQVPALPARPGQRGDGGRCSVLADWHLVVTNRPFLLFALAMIGCYVLSFQVYLALPLRAKLVAGGGNAATVLVAVLFVVSAATAVVGQLRLTAWFRDCWPPGRCLVVGMAVLGTAYLPLALIPDGDGPGGPVAAVGATVLAAALLAVGNAAMFPFEMDTVIRLSGGRLVATHYGFYSTVVGVGIVLGNVFTGTVFDLAHRAGWPEALWGGLALIGACGVYALHRLDRSQQLAADEGVDELPVG